MRQAGAPPWGRRDAGGTDSAGRAGDVDVTVGHVGRAGAAGTGDDDPGGANRGAGVLTMTGSSLAGVDTAVQGATVDSAGRLDPGRPAQARVRGGVLSVELAAGSAWTADPRGRRSRRPPDNLRHVY